MHKNFPSLETEEELKQVFVDYVQAHSTEAVHGLTPSDFSHSVSHRIYTEWCLGCKNINHNGYTGEAYQKFVDDEVHHAIKRRNQSTASRTLGAASYEDYLAIRKRVLGGLVKKAMYMIDKSPPFQLNKNLRDSLENWISQ